MASGRRPAYKKKLAGVSTKADKEEKAVKEIESAVLPPDNMVKKFDTLPPGQEATNNMPSARPIEGLMTRMSR